MMTRTHIQSTRSVFQPVTAAPAIGLRRNRGACRGSSYDDSVPPIVNQVLQSTGQPLDTGTRAFFEPRFGHDFSNVRVHTDSRSAESAQSVNAHAYTVGRDVVFDAGHYAPETAAGR